MNRYTYVPKDYPIEIKAYLAGIVDGEGSIYIGRPRKNVKTGAYYYMTVLSVNSTDAILIDWLFSKFGGHKGTYTRKQLAHNSRKQVYYWHATGERLLHLCQVILPFLVIKPRQAEIMIKMRQSYGLEHVKGKWGVQSHTNETMLLRDSLYHELKSIHNRTYSHITKKTLAPCRPVKDVQVN